MQSSTGRHNDQVSRRDGNASQTDDGFSSVGDDDADGDVQRVRKSRNSHPSEWIADSKARGNKASKAKKAIADKVVIFLVVDKIFSCNIKKACLLNLASNIHTKIFKNRFVKNLTILCKTGF